jgi:hypothetical protein
MVDLCKSYSPFHVPLRAVAINHFLKLCIIFISNNLKYIIFHHSKRLLANCPRRIHISWFQHSLHSFMPQKRLWLLQISTIREIGIICACSDHGQPRYQIWIECDKRQITSCVHKMCERTYGQTNMKRAMTLEKINHPWNRYNMRMLRSWPIKIPNMNKMRQKTND